MPRILIKRLHLPATAIPARTTVNPDNPAGDGPSALWAIAGLAILAIVARRAIAARS